MELLDELRNDEPVTYFFYEQLGKRAVDPETLIDNGIDLWVQTATRYGVSELWGFAQKLLDEVSLEDEISHVESFRRAIIIGDIVPPGWTDAPAFPFKGLLVSALYFKEAHRALATPPRERASHLIITAYYYLGVNSTESELMAQARKQAQKNATKTEEVRLLVVAALDLIVEKRAPVSLTRAKSLVLDMLTAAEEDVASQLLAYADKSGIDRTLSASDRRRTALERIESLLDLWARPTGPYPGIARLFAKAREPRPDISVEQDAEEAVHQMRVNPVSVRPNLLEFIWIHPDGHRTTVRLSRDVT